MNLTKVQLVQLLTKLYNSNHKYICIACGKTHDDKTHGDSSQ